MSTTDEGQVFPTKTSVLILVVEDDRLALAGLASGLEERGYRVQKAGSGESAVTLAHEEPPHLVLMDICLPGMSGIDAARKIQSKANIPIIFLSALDGAEVVSEAITLGSISYLVKPITITQLVPAIETALARSREISTLRASGEHLSIALTQSREISIAIGVLMERHNISAESAFEMLRSHARNTGRKTVDIARDVITSAQNYLPKSLD